MFQNSTLTTTNSVTVKYNKSGGGVSPSRAESQPPKLKNGHQERDDVIINTPQSGVTSVLLKVTDCDGASISIHHPLMEESPNKSTEKSGKSEDFV